MYKLYRCSIFPKRRFHFCIPEAFDPAKLRYDLRQLINGKVVSDLEEAIPDGENPSTTRLRRNARLADEISRKIKLEIVKLRMSCIK